MASNSPTYNVLDNFGLHHFALIGNDKGVRRALRNGADINSLDAAGRTAVMCAVSGENWQNMDVCDSSLMSLKRINALKTIVSHPDINLLTLNAPHQSVNGVIPLCMAAWLNQPQAVRVLLNDSVDSVSVDGMDSHGATALMYAVRDGNLEVVQILLLHGAHPDFRDRNHRTSIHFSLLHPHILWLCETVLRRHRWRQSKLANLTRSTADGGGLADLATASIHLLNDLQPPSPSHFTPEATSRLTGALVSCICTSDFQSLHSLLFTSASSGLHPTSTISTLVNHPDSKGWSPVHYCVAAPQPSVQILDALYYAGADISLFTRQEKHTPLHILARRVYASYGNHDATHSLHDFCLHLIQDLHAPLSARDEADETCIHIAAEHGHSIELLRLFLDCDTTGVVRQMKNSRGLTPIEVAKDEFLYAFNIDEDGPRPTSALSNRTIRPTDSFASPSSISALNTFPETCIYSPENIDINYMVQQLLSSLRVTSLSASHSTNLTHIQTLEGQIQDAQRYFNLVSVHFRACIEEVSRVVQDLQKNTERIDSVRNGVALASSGKLALRGISPVQSKKRNQDSEDSRLTFFDHNEIVYYFRSLPAITPSAPSSPQPEQTAFDLDMLQNLVTQPIDYLDSSIDNALRTSKVVLEVTQRDLQSISECLESAEQFIDMAKQSISRTQRIFRRAIEKREGMITSLQTAASNQDQSTTKRKHFPGFLGHKHGISTRPSKPSISTIRSVSSSASSVDAAQRENDDEDIRMIQRLLLRKMEAQTSGAWDEVGKVMSWLQIVKEAVRSVKRRAYL